MILGRSRYEKEVMECLAFVISGISELPEFEVLAVGISGFQDFLIWGFGNFWISRFLDLGIPGLMDFRISGIRDFEISGVWNFGISGFSLTSSLNSSP